MSEDPNVARARANVGELKRAIRAERATIADYRDRLKTGRGNFPRAGLLHGIERCEHNIKVLKQAVIDANAQIREMAGQVRINEELAKLREGIEIPVEYENAAEEDDADGRTRLH